MKTKILIIGLGLVATMMLSACNIIKDENLGSVVNSLSAEHDVNNLTQSLDQAKLVYADNRDFFTVNDRQQIDNGLVKIELTVASFKAYKESKTIQKLTSTADFLADYRQARQGYLAIRQVLVRRKDDLNPKNLSAFAQFDQNAQRVDTWAYKLAANESSSQRIKTVTELITQGATLITSTTKIISAVSKV